ADGICMPLHKTPKLTWARVLVRFVCLPDERHITGPRSGTAVVDADRVSAGYLDVHLVAGVDPHDVGSRCVNCSLGDGRGARRFQANPFDVGAGNMLQTHLTYSLFKDGGATAHDQHRSAGGWRNRCAVHAHRKVV